MKREINAHFDAEDWYFTSPSGIKVAYEGDLGAYECLLGALSGCYFSTFEDLAGDKVSYKAVDVKVEGEKREEVPTTLKYTKLTLTASGVSDEATFIALAHEASRVCSIWQTIKNVSEMELEINFRK